MGRKPKASKETKIKIYKAYEKAEGSFQRLAKSIGISQTTVKHW